MQSAEREDDGDAQSTLSSATLEKWSRLAENLQAKLESTKRENADLKERLERQSIEYDDLRDAHAFQDERIDDLEFQCLEKSAKISNLSEILESRDTNELEERLLVKSMEHAEMALSVDRLRHALQKCEAANQRLLDEKGSLTMVNEELTKKLEDCTAAWQKSKMEQERNHKLLIEMGDVVQTLNSATAEFEKEKAANAGVSSCSPQGANPLDSIKRKIKAMEEDRQRLIHECESLREEKVSNHERIQELETQCQSLSSSQTADSTEGSWIANKQGELGSRLDTQTSPMSINTSILDQASSQYDENGSTVSDASSFSDVVPPPDVLLQEHKTLKKYYEEALARIIRMSAELSKSKVSAQDIREKQSYIEELKERLEQMQTERDASRKDNRKIEKELEDALLLAENTMVKHVACKKKLEEYQTEYKELKEKYDHLEKEYSKQIEEIEGQVTDTEKFFQVQCESLKKKHANKMNKILKEKEELEKEFEETVNAEKERHDELNEEFDVFMEMHTQLEDDLSDLQKKYDEALTNIVDLEDQVQQIKEMGSAEKAKLEKRIEEQTKAIKELKAAVDKSKASMQEAILQQQKLRRENEAVLAKHGGLVTQLNQATEKNKQDESTIKELRDNCCDMEDRLKRVEQDASNRFNLLQSSYQMALSRISDLIVQLHDVGLPIGESTQQEIVNQCPVAHERIKLLEKELRGGGRAGPIDSGPNDPPATERFHDDYCNLLKDLVRARRHEESSRPFWYDRIVHQSKLAIIHQHLLAETSSALQFPASHLSVDFSVLDFIRYQRHLQFVLGSLASREGELSGEAPTTISMNTPATPGEPRAVTEGTKEDEFLSSLVNPVFLEHQRRLAVVHFDVFARAQAMQQSESSVVEHCDDEDWNIHDGPDNIDEAKWALRNLKGETQKIKLAANTAKIRHEAREKEHRVVRMQYQKLLEEYNQAVMKNNQDIDTSANTDVKTAVEKIQKDEELKRLKDQLRMAELKVERMAMELRTTKSNADVAQRKQEEGEKNLQDAIGHQEELEAQHPHHHPSPIQQRQHQGQQSPPASPIFRARDGLPPLAADQRQEDGATSNGNGDTCTTPYNLVSSFDGSHLTSVGGVSSAEGRDERCEENKSMLFEDGNNNNKVQFESEIGRYLQLQKDHDQALRTIEQLKSELFEAEQCAQHARSQLKHREEDLRDVIREYNKIKEESEILFSQIQEKVKEEEKRKAEESESGFDDNDETKNGMESSSSSEGADSLIRERNVALGKISFLETELEKAQAAAKLARKKQLLREDHLRQVIGQYKELDEEHKKTKEQFEQLQATLHQPSRVLLVEPEGRQRSPGMNDETREKAVGSPIRQQQQSVLRKSIIRSSDDTASSKTSDKSTKTATTQNKNGKTKRKPWFRDLGHIKTSEKNNARLHGKM